MTAIATPPPAFHTPPAPEPAPAAGSGWGWTLLRGLLGGVALGAAFRAWMRLVSTSPSFSWSGTLFIVGLCTVAVLLASIASTVRRRVGRRWVRGVARVLSVAGFALLGAGPGAITVPVWLFGGLAWGRRTWPRWVRLLLAAGAVAGLVLFVVLTLPDAADLGVGRTAAAYITYLPLMAVIARLFAIPSRSP